VKRVLSQSQEQPNFLIVQELFRRIYASNPKRELKFFSVISDLLIPSDFSLATTFASVAIEA
jgi:hypothetical protein